MPTEEQEVAIETQVPFAPLLRSPLTVGQQWSRPEQMFAPFLANGFHENQSLGEHWVGAGVGAGAVVARPRTVPADAVAAMTAMPTKILLEETMTIACV